jgi:hypothetical protein
MAGILILTGAGQSTPLVGFADDMKHELADMSDILKRAAEEVIQPAFGRNYDRSGLKKGTGILKQALTKTGSTGNYLRITAQSVTAGLDYGREPYFRWATEGRGDVYPRTKKFLKFDINGKTVFTKHSRPAPPRPVVFLSPEDFQLLAGRLTEMLVARGATRLPK